MALLRNNTAGSISPIEIFYSYSHKDEKLREVLETHLSLMKREGLIAGWNDRRIAAGSEWADAIDENLNSARIILLLVSAYFIASDYCYDKEMMRAMERNEAGEALVIPVILRPCDWTKAPFGKLQGLPKDAKPITKWPNRDEAFLDVALGIRKAIAGIKNGGSSPSPSVSLHASPSGTLPPICNLPHLRNPNFTGRDELLKDLHDALNSGKPAALTQAMYGLGGVGKTQTAIEYIYRHAAEYELVWWIRSEEPAKLAADYAALAEPLRLPERSAQDQRIVVEAVRDALAKRGRWLIVFDNTNGPDQIREFLPLGGSGHNLITSRSTAFGGLAHPLKVPTMAPDKAVEFLLSRSQQTDKAAAADLAKELGYLPLALEHAGAYMEETGTAISSYLETFRTKQKALLAKAYPPTGYQATVATTWELSFVEAEKQSAAAGQLMNLCAFLAPDDVGREMLREGAEVLPEPLAQAVADDLQWNDAVGALRKYSLVEVQDGALSVHRLVQLVMRERLSEEGRKQFAGAAVRVVNGAFPYIEDEVGTWARSGRMLPHAMSAAGFAEELQVELKTCGRLLNQVGLYLQRRAEFSAAKSVLERAVKISESAYGWERPEVATTLNSLGLVLQELGDLEEARKNFQRALKISETAYGLEHPTVATRLSNLGLALRDLGDLEGARKNFERALKIGETVYGSEHPEVATYVNNLGLVLKELGDLKGARKNFERALKIDEAVYGPNHPEVGVDLGNLGVVLGELGDLDGAQKNFERALKIGETVYGSEHPRVAMDLKNLGDVLRELGDREGTRKNYERALKIDETVYGPVHPAVAVDLNNLGNVLQELGDLEGARKNFERALGILERSLGKEHSKTRIVRGNLERLG